MKKIITLFFLTGSVAVYAQPKTVTQAIITTKTTIVAPESDAAASAGSDRAGTEGREVGSEPGRV